MTRDITRPVGSGHFCFPVEDGYVVFQRRKMKLSVREQLFECDVLRSFKGNHKLAVLIIRRPAEDKDLVIAKFVCKEDDTCLSFQIRFRKSR